MEASDEGHIHGRTIIHVYAFQQIQLSKRS